jgi:MoaA/NifB/PqqE/SkfB family radical SAM enzyme
MCGQWSEEGYARTGRGRRGRVLDLGEWKRLADEVAAHGVTSVLLRGGEPFLFPGIVGLLEHLRGLGISVAIDSNGTRLGDFASDLVRLGGIHVTVSVDGPEAVHDAVRGVPGSFRQIEEGLAKVSALDRGTPRRVSRSICFTISPWSLPGLGDMPGVARSLGVDTITIVPYYYAPQSLGETWEREIREAFGDEAFAWRGFHHEGELLEERTPDGVQNDFRQAQQVVLVVRHVGGVHLAIEVGRAEEHAEARVLPDQGHVADVGPGGENGPWREGR